MRGICPPFSVCCNVVVVDQSRVFETKCGLQSKPKPQKQFKCSSSWWFLDLSSYRFITADFHSDLGELVEPEEEPKGQKPTTTPPSTPVRAEEGRLTWLTWHYPACLVQLGFVQSSGWVFGLLYRGNAEAPARQRARLSWGVFMLWSLIILLWVLCCVFCNNRPRGFDYLIRFMLW